jgi:XTP/dITP diphosphohydrolase
LVIPALNNFPSAYSKCVEETIKEDGILKLMEGINNREAYFLEVLAYTEYGKEPVVFVSKTEGTIATQKAGEFDWGYDKIFIPKGETKTLACFEDNKRW